MPEEQAFLSAIMANPDDQTTKLVYADWLDERADPRAEILRLRVQIATPHENTLAARERLAELEKAAPAKWLVQLGGPVWCFAGNVVEARPYGPGGAETRRGTRLFKPNAKVYLASLRHAYLLLAGPSTPAHRYETVRVVGRHRKSVDWIASVVRANLVTGWRVELVYQPGALARLKREQWAGFRLPRGAFVCPEDTRSPEAIRGLLAALDVRSV
ncbi:MAG: TIGR02996 domain-containing protein [Planctomycetes bacterium]|nr:TIGR02996 domain-containing protein [Planctomycetota bacterium]